MFQYNRRFTAFNYIPVKGSQHWKIYSIRTLLSVCINTLHTVAYKESSSRSHQQIAIITSTKLFVYKYIGKHLVQLLTIFIISDSDRKLIIFNIVLTEAK